MSAASVRCSGPPALLMGITETVTGSSATTIPGGVPIASATSVSVIGGHDLTPDGADPAAYKLNWKYSSTGPATYPHPKGWGVQFSVAGTKDVEFLVYARTGAAWNLWVDGRPAWDLPRTTPLTTDARNLIKFTLPDAGPHDIRFYMNNLSLSTIFGAPGATASAEPVAGPRVFFLGDSVTQGGRQSTGGDLGSWIWRFGAMCGFVDVWDGGMGSTGAIADGDGASANYVTRAITDVAPATPNIVFITSYYNDRVYPAAQIGDAFEATIDTVAALPAKPTVVVTGSLDPAGVNGAPYDAIDAAIRAACNARGVAYIEPRTGHVYDGRGGQLGGGGPWVTEANRSRIIGTDGVHPTDAGQAYIAQRMVDAFSLLQNQRD